MGSTIAEDIFPIPSVQLVELKVLFRTYESLLTVLVPYIKYFLPVSKLFVELLIDLC